MSQSTLSQPVAELPVADVVSAQAYYRDVLGFEIGWSAHEMGMGAVSRGEIALFFRKSTGPIVSNVHWVFAPELDATYAELTASGADIVEPIEDKPWGHRQFALRDLNGHLFYFHLD